MKRPLLGLVAALSALAVGSAAHAANYTFDISGQGYINFVDVGPQTITGDIYGLPSTTGSGFAASDVTVNDPFVSPFVGPIDLGGGGSFAITNGQITGASFAGGATADVFFNSLNLNDSIGSYDAAFFLVGFYGIDNGAVTYASAVPEPTIWSLMIVGVGGLGLTLRRGRRVGGRQPLRGLAA